MHGDPLRPHLPHSLPDKLLKKSDYDNASSIWWPFNWCREHVQKYIINQNQNQVPDRLLSAFTKGLAKSKI